MIARLEANGKTKSIVPALQIERVLYDEPDLLGRTYDEIARRFGVDRLVVIQLEEFRLAEPGNLYVWAASRRRNCWWSRRTVTSRTTFVSRRT